MNNWITLPTMGSFGRLGNQLWQLAAGLAHARRNQAELHLQLWEYSSHFPTLGTTPGVSFHRTIQPSGMWAEPAWNFERLPPFWPRMGLHGYFQSTAWWKGLDKNKIRAALTPAHNPEVPENAVVLHVRRGDYLKLKEYHHVPDDDWMVRAVQHCQKAGGTGPVIICTDDPIWCARRWPAYEVSQQSETWDLARMAKAKYLVMSPSSLSWWGAFLGGKRTVVAPRTWFGPANATHRVEQLNPKEGWVWLP